MRCLQEDYKAAAHKYDARPSIELGADEIHLWFTFCDQISDASILAEYRRLLAPEEKEREARFRFDRDRVRYIISHALVRAVLSRYAPLAPCEWVFRTNAYGRPYVDNPEGCQIALAFSMSRSNGIVVLGVTKGKALGVDVENSSSRSVPVDSVSRFFSSDEAAVLARMRGREKTHQLYEYWTFKEAYAKARGVGLSLPLDKLSFHYPQDGNVQMTLSPDLTDDATRWAFWQLRASSRFLVAVCAECPSSSTLITRQTVPLVCERNFSPTVLRTSA